jgi:uncharacterized protein (DUF1800 family)
MGRAGVATPATRDDVARLFARAAFGATKNDLDVWTGKDYATVVDALFPPATPVPIPGPDEVARTQQESVQYDLAPSQRWWLEHMRKSPWPLLEKATLFWHTHFATGYTGAPDVGAMMKQNNTLRTHALGDFRKLLHAITIDGAMLYWLSGYQNRRGAINENHGRELFELFTMGTMPQQYTETDIRQAAKALSGWVVNASRVGTFDTNRHDQSVKTIFGQQIGGYPAKDAREATEYQEVCNLALDQDTTAKFIAYKMVCAYAYVPDTRDLLNDPDPLVDAVAMALRPSWTDPGGVWDITKALKTLLNHNLFRYAQKTNGQALVRSPIEVMVHLGKITQANLDNTNATGWMPLNALQRMAQTPFRPPNVAGWPVAAEWLSASTLQGRYNAGEMMGRVWESQAATTAKTVTLPASGDIAAWTAFMGLGTLSTLTKNAVSAFLANPGTSDEPTKQKSVLTIIASSPDWQVI